MVFNLNRNKITIVVQKFLFNVRCFPIKVALSINIISYQLIKDATLIAKLLILNKDVCDFILLRVKI